MEVELMVTKRDDDDDRQGEYREICLGKVGRQSFAKLHDFLVSQEHKLNSQVVPKTKLMVGCIIQPSKSYF